MNNGTMGLGMLITVFISTKRTILWSWETRLYTSDKRGYNPFPVQ